MNGKRKTQTEFVNEVNSKYNGEYTVVGNYINAKTKIEFKHNNCNKNFFMTPSNILYGQGCPHCRYIKCSNSQLMSTDDFKKEVYNLVGDEYSVLSEYKGRYKDVLFKHNLCNTEFHMKPTTFVNKGSRCTNKNCFHHRMSMVMRDDESTFKEKFDNRSNGEYELLSTYELSHKKILIKHLTCGNKFKMKPNNFIFGQGCPYCNISKAELKIRNFCINNDIKYIWQKSYDDLTGINDGLLFYDFYFPNNNFLLEYQGEFHDGTLVDKCQSKEKLLTQQEHDRRKRQYAKDHDIKLLEIWYWDFENIEEILSRELGLVT